MQQYCDHQFTRPRYGIRQQLTGYFLVQTRTLFCPIRSQVECMKLLHSQEVDIVCRVDGLRYTIHLVSDGYASSKLRRILYIVHPSTVRMWKSRRQCRVSTGDISYQNTIDVQETRCMQLSHHLLNHEQILGRYIQPYVESFNKL